MGTRHQWIAIFGTVVVSSALALGQSAEKPFRRGDVNFDGRVSVADALHILCYL